ncbi:MAG: gliding motility-associated C-terminal domain-containing protein, partial [Flavobacteriaceae bacterium]|nr:gliding motility-associated C-terminal domain-containing protein [Flavobacteriaceae bacterium]
NEVFEIIGIEEQYPDFTIRIYNRWGNLVYDYDNNGSTDPEWWDGISNGRVTINKGIKVPTGTYYYVIDFNDGEREPLVDWIYLTRSE